LARGFLAHEFQSVYAHSVNGEKDAVDDKGNPAYQSMQAGSAEVIADLVAGGYIIKKREGLVNHYWLNTEAPLRRPEMQDKKVKDLIELSTSRQPKLRRRARPQ
jgi:hypothetical protein